MRLDGGVGAETFDTPSGGALSRLRCDSAVRAEH